MAKQPWDPSVQSMAALPDVVQRLAEQYSVDNGAWETRFCAQQSDVMDAVQRMRAKAQGTGNLKTSAEQTVETKTTQGGEQVIVVEPANPDAAYVPVIRLEVVYGPPPADYPYYPYYLSGIPPGDGLAWGRPDLPWVAWADDNWGNCNWDNGDINH